MTLGPNRVAPTGDLVAVGVRGAWMGNRGILYGRNGSVTEQPVITRPYATKAWITCALEFRGWRALQWQPGHYTVLFFPDEAVALAAGHRPCALCRRADYRAFRDAAAENSPPLSAKDVDRRLHAERLVRGTHRRRLHTHPWTQLPDGAFVLLAGTPGLIVGDAVVPWSPQGYGPAVPRPTGGQADVITPPLSLTALTAGYPVQIDFTARDLAAVRS